VARTLTVSGQLNGGEANAPFEGSVIVRVSPLPGGVDCDGKVGVQDLVLVVSAYGSHPDEPWWNDNANLAAPWDSIGLTVLVTIVVHFGQNVP
jgi:hypothetical protein